MEQFDLKEKLQLIVDEQFDKILEIKTGDKSYHIAIMKDQIPQIVILYVDNNTFWLGFSNRQIIEKNELDYKLVNNNNGEIDGLFIGNINKLKSSAYRFKISREIMNSLDHFPEGNVNEIIFKHKQKRVGHALTKMLKEFPQDMVTAH